MVIRGEKYRKGMLKYGSEEPLHSYLELKIHTNLPENCWNNPCTYLHAHYHHAGKILSKNKRLTLGAHQHQHSIEYAMPSRHFLFTAFRKGDESTEIIVVVITMKKLLPQVFKPWKYLADLNKKTVTDSVHGNPI